MRNQSLASVAKSSILPLILAASLVTGLSAYARSPVYKWKDANGQSHYSQSPPEGVKYQTIMLTGEPGDATNPASATASQPATPAATSNGTTGNPANPTPAQVQRQKLCANARANVTTLTEHATVVGDVNGDGTPVTLDAKQHDSAMIDANKQVDLYCTN